MEKKGIVKSWKDLYKEFWEKKNDKEKGEGE